MTDVEGDNQHPLIGVYRDAMAQQSTAEQRVGKWADRRAQALAGLNADGWSYRRIGEALGLSATRVQQLVERGREVHPKWMDAAAPS